MKDLDLRFLKIIVILAFLERLEGLKINYLFFKLDLIDYNKIYSSGGIHQRRLLEKLLKIMIRLKGRSLMTLKL